MFKLTLSYKLVRFARYSPHAIKYRTNAATCLHGRKQQKKKKTFATIVLALFKSKVES